MSDVNGLCHSGRMSEDSKAHLCPARREVQSNDRRQLDFHLNLHPPCVPTQQLFSNRTTGFNIVGQSKLSLVPANIMENSPQIIVETPTPSGAEDLDRTTNKRII
ncbi:hypothetical protein OUZ56_003733 [Daphnia magna]|uniref:Uncharacterized protein n=1 Tax=Daphnia magna TaxID=35525 RepID=A0ABR0A9T0_9CRUS|nr:hypothetical protein OUZ56_003733 [Daphnia magna]